MDKLKVILSGGGTGGHIYPAVSVAEALQRRFGDRVEILFVGARGKMEMEKVPALGYHIIGLPVVGLQRRITPANFLFPFRMLGSFLHAWHILRRFKADVAIGFGGYASAPVLAAAQLTGIPTLIQEQNCYAGKANKSLASRARRICVAYEGAERFFPKDRIVLTGNPLRGRFGKAKEYRREALGYFGFTPDRPVVLVVGGSLGTRTLNNMMKENIDRVVSEGKIQVIWQTGKYYEQEIDAFMKGRPSQGIWRNAFIEEMDMAYAAADMVVARAGASTVSELCLVGTPAIFVPSPNVAEDHQTKNAMALVEKDAALMIPDAEAAQKIFPAIERLLANPGQLKRMSENMLALGINDSADRIVDEIIAVVGFRENSSAEKQAAKPEPEKTPVRKKNID